MIPRVLPVPAACCGLLALLLASGVRAQTTLDPVVVTATRTPQQAANVLSDVRVIDEQAIADAGASTLTELLQAQGGVEIAANGGPGRLSSVFLRGANANQVLVLVDGVRVASATAGLNAFEAIPLSQIERIEVLRGPASSLYGADAIGGVIQIFTKQRERLDARVGAGRWGTREAGVGVGRAFGDTFVSLQAGVSRTDGFSATNAGQPTYFDPDADGYRNRNLGASVKHAWATGHDVTLRVLASDGKSHFDDATFPPPDFTPVPVDSTERMRLSTVALESRNRLGAQWTSLLRVARGSDHRRTTSPDGTVRFETDQDQALWQHDVAALGGQLAAGLEWRREQVTSDTEFDQTSRRIASAFASYAAQLDRHLLQLSLRHDDDSQFGGQASGNLAYGFRVTPALRLSAGVGSAFKAPTFNDLYYPGFSNPELKPERSRGLELAARYDGGRFDGALTLFRQRIRDLIQFDFATSRPVNLARASNRGVTLGGGWREGIWRARAELTRQDPENGDGEPLPRRARTHATASVGVDAQPWRAGVEWVGSGARVDNAFAPPPPRLAGYGLVHLHAAYALTPAWTASLRVNNALDKRYELVDGFNTPRRNAFVALEYATK